MEKSDIAIVAVCIILLFLWMTRTPHYGPPPPAREKTAATAGSDDTTPTAKNDVADQASLTAPAAQTIANLATAVPDEYRNLPPAEPVNLELQGIVTFTIDPEKGGVTGVRLYRYHDTENREVLQLKFTEHPFLGVNTEGVPWAFSHARIDRLESQVLEISRAIVGANAIVKQTWRIDPANPYEIDYRLVLTNHGDQPLTFESLAVNCGAMEPLEVSRGFMGAGGMDQRIDVLHAGKNSPTTFDITKILKFDAADVEGARRWQHHWLAVQNKYFVSLVAAEKPFSGCRMGTAERVDPASGKPAGAQLWGRSYLDEDTLSSKETKEWALRCFVGPKEYDSLKRLGRKQESLLQFDLFLFFHAGWMEGISLGILWMLSKLHSIFHNYGVAIIGITVIVRTVFWPITHQSTVWSKRMQKIQPLAQEIREKYKNDPQKMQQKTLDLYRDHKVNPMAGCLPILLQIPVFFALFNVLRSAVELRQASFLWASDLSAQDSIATIPMINVSVNPLAILMGVTMFLQQKTMPASPDPMQQKVMEFMTIFFVIILYTMPSGLTLYWTINQLVSIFQYKVTRLMEDKKA